MSEVISLAVEPRARAGKGASRAVRRDGRVPAVIYGAKQDPELVSVKLNELTRILNRGHFFNSVFDITIDGRSQRVLPRDLQVHPVTEVPLHIDLLRISKGDRIIIQLPVRFIDHDKAPALKAGGVLNVVRHEIEVECPADAIPDEVVISLAGRGLHDSIHISAVPLPEGVVPTIERDFTIATLAPSSVSRSDADADAAEEAAAGEAKE